MQRIFVGTAALLFGCAVWAQTAGDAGQFSGQLRLQWTGQQAAQQGPLAQANELQSGVVPLPASDVALATELRASGHGLSSITTLQQQRTGSDATQSRAWVNEMYASHNGGAWQFSAGKKIVAWDVGYGFRPNDVVQQEVRRTLVSSTDEGRPVLLAEHFSADSAWSWVWVNPTASTEALGAKEPALALRVYQRDGSVDWHGFARVGAHSGASVGVAAAWVASDPLELHSSLRLGQRFDSQTLGAGVNGLVASNPWQPDSGQNLRQFLVGGTWTNANQFSLLGEAWWDGTALTDAQWDAWSQRNAQLASLATRGAPAAAVAGNLAWQAQAFSVSPSLRRRNVFLRLSWQREAWQPALDMLYTPADHGRVLTASLSWQGDRVQLQGGLRVYGGPAEAVLTQLPARSLAYVATIWSF